MNNSELSCNPKIEARLGAFVALVATLGFALTFQTTYYGDAALLLKTYRQGNSTGHAAHAVVTRLLSGSGFALEASARIASLLPAGIGVGLLVMALLRVGVRTGFAVVVALLFALTPSVAFFATTIEVHGLQLLGVCAAMYCGIRAFGDCPALRIRPQPPLITLPQSSPRSAFLWFLLAALCLALTHPLNMPALVGLAGLTLFGLLRRGMTKKRVAIVTLLLGGLGVLLGLTVASIYKARQGLDLAGILATFAWPLGELAADGSGAPALFFNFRAALLLPAAGLLGIGGFGLLFLRPRRLAFALSLWVLFPLLFVLGIDAHEHGAYFLVALPALSIGVAAILEQLAVWSTPTFGKRGPLVTTLLIGYAFASMHHNNYREELALDDFAEREWLDALGAFTNGRGIFLAQDLEHQTAVTNHLGLQSDNLRYFILLPEEEQMELMKVYRAWARLAADHGEPLYIPEAVFALAPSQPTLQATLDYLSEEFHFEHVALGGGYGIWQGR